MCAAVRTRAGFTLVELLVSLTVLAILVAMVVVAINSTQQHARQMATQSLVQRIDQVLKAKWDEYRYRPLNIELDSLNNPYNPSSGRTPPQLLPEEAGRVRLMMMRDLIRMELPDRQSDLIQSFSPLVFRTPTPIKATVVAYDGNKVAYAGEQRLPWYYPYANTVAPSQTLAYRARLIDLASQTDANGNPRQWTQQYESAECLYMILSTTTVNGISALDVIAPVQIQDMDGDGMPEVVDSWSNPIAWIRWPAGSNKPVIADAAEDEFDIMAADWGSVRADVETPYSLTPMVISPGPDNTLGIITTEYPTTPYSAMQWPVGKTNSDSAVTAPYYFIDPYDRENTGSDHSTRPGAVMPAGNPFVADNISSFDL